ncbi:hypothetical protein [Actinoplanes sp. NPDC026623]|uniref:hypothetical protein n=1 Tax=Actinoplanes sp. NPDC026623 TaxID=3155610 RepID=UPI0033DABCC7
MTKKVSRPLAVATAIAVVTIGVFAAPAPAGAHWSCGRSAPSDIDSSGNNWVVESTVSRVGSSLRCAVQSLGINANLDLDYHCYAKDINGEDTWTYVVAVGVNKRGWVKDSTLWDNGSSVRCVGDTNTLAAAKIAS